MNTLPLILEEKQVPRTQLLNLPTATPGTAFIYANRDGRVEDLGRPMGVSEALFSKFTYRYVVNTAVVQVHLTADLPSRQDGFTFALAAGGRLRVHDPSAVVSRQVRDAYPIVFQHVAGLAAGVAEQYEPDRRAQAQREINALLAAPIVLDDGMTLTGFTARLSLDQLALEQLTQQRQLRHSVSQDGIQETWELAKQNNRFQDALGKGTSNETLIAMLLAQNTGNAAAVLSGRNEQIIRAEAQSNADKQAQLDLINKMIDAGLMQDVDIEDLRNAIVRGAFMAVGGAGAASSPAIATSPFAATAPQPLAAPPTQPAPSQAQSHAPSQAQSNTIPLQPGPGQPAQPAQPGGAANGGAGVVKWKARNGGQPNNQTGS